MVDEIKDVGTGRQILRETAGIRKEMVEIGKQLKTASERESVRLGLKEAELERDLERVLGGRNP